MLLYADNKKKKHRGSEQRFQRIKKTSTEEFNNLKNKTVSDAINMTHCKSVVAPDKSDDDECMKRFMDACMGQ